MHLGWCLQDSFPWGHFKGDGIVKRLPELIEVAVWLHKYGSGPSYREVLQCWDRFWREQRRRGFSAWVADALRGVTMREVAELLAASPQLFGIQIDGVTKAMSCLDGPDGIVNTVENGFYAFYLEPCSRRGDPPGEAEAIMRARAVSATRELRPMAAASAPHAAAFLAEVQRKFAALFQREILHEAHLTQKHRLTTVHKATLEVEVAGALAAQRRYEAKAAEAERDEQQLQQEEQGEDQQKKLKRAQKEKTRTKRLATGALEGIPAKKRVLAEVMAEELLVKVSFLDALVKLAPPEQPVVEAVQAFPVGLDILTMLVRARVLRDAVLPATVLDELCVCIRSRSDDQFKDILGDILDSPCEFGTRCGWARDAGEGGGRSRKRARCKYAYFASAGGDTVLFINGAPLLAAEQGNRDSNLQTFRHFEALADVVLPMHPQLEIKTACAVCIHKQKELWGRHLEAKQVRGDTVGVLRTAFQTELMRL